MHSKKHALGREASRERETGKAAVGRACLVMSRQRAQHIH